MRYVLIAVVISACLYALCGCRATVTNKPVAEVPAPKVTKTTTVTTKVETPVPVYQTVVDVKTTQKTETNANVPAKPLHTVTVPGDKLPEPGK